MPIGQRKVRTGQVLSANMNKTVVVGVSRSRMHPLYNKAVRLTKRYKAHDENSECKEGDTVEITETRPLSKEKRWRVTAILTRGDQAATAIIRGEPVIKIEETGEDEAEEDKKE